MNELWYTANLKITYRNISTEQLIKLIYVLNRIKMRDWAIDNRIKGCCILQDYIIEPDYADDFDGPDGFYKITFSSNCNLTDANTYIKNLVRYIKETTGIELP